ncbi:MAG: major facilitator superfamily 1 [Candidatus Levybacteria bacterium]|nr:major facilitator superfamily 1 [Candidatus Levybacteria bacterium]
MFKNIFNKYFSGLTRNTFLLSLVSLFADISTEMLYPILPIFLTQTLKSGGAIVGIIEGIATATQNIVQGFSGFLSDKLKQRKVIALIGFSIAALAKPLIGFATIWQHVLTARFFDRMGTGIRSAPRDALIATSTDEQHRGKAFGLEGLGDNLGAFLGPLIAVVLLFYFKLDIRNIFFLALIPGLLTVILVSFVKEKKLAEIKTKIDVSISHFPANYWKYLTATFIFGLGNSSSAFLILQTRSIGISLEATIIIYAFFNLAAALVSYPSGSLSDKWGRKNILLLAFFLFLLTYLGFAFSKNFLVIAILFLLYGGFQGIFRSVGKSFAADFTPPQLRASGLGWYSATIGLTGLGASIIAGQLWDKIGHQQVFIFGAVFAVLGILTLLFLVPEKNRN